MISAAAPPAVPPGVGPRGPAEACAEGESRAQGALGARPVAHHCQGRPKLGLGQRRREVVELGVHIVAELPDRCTAVAGQDIEGIRSGFAAALEVLRVADVVGETIQGLVEGTRAHRVARLLGPGQEVSHEAREPYVPVRRTPDAERTGCVLHLEDAGDRSIHTLAQIGIARQADALGNGVGVEERHGAADGLLGASVRIAIERGEDARDVKAALRPDRHHHFRAARYQVLHQVFRQGDLATLRRQGAYGHAADVACRYLDLEVERPPDVDAAVLARGTPGFSGADLANLVNEAALLAARRNKRLVTQSEFEDSKDKVMMGAERRSMIMTEEEKLATAYHETGHALVNILVDVVHGLIDPRLREQG